MRFLAVVALLSSLAGCVGGEPPRGATPSPSQIEAEKLIDAFYSYDPRQLLAAMVNSPVSQPQLLFYQGWAEGGNYAVIDRQPCRHLGRNKITCAITVRDDLIEALGTGYWVTDKFHLTIRDGKIVQVSNSSNDPPEFDLALNWLRQERPHVMAGPCRGFFAGGATPKDCVRAVVEGFNAYRTSIQSK